MITKTTLRAAVTVFAAAALAACASVPSTPGQTTSPTSVVETQPDASTTTSPPPSTTSTIANGVEVPEVTGLSFDAALRLADQHDLDLAVTTTYIPGAVENLDVVAAQNPRPGDSIASGSSIEVSLYSVESPPEIEATAVITDQADGVITEFLEQANRFGLNSGRQSIADNGAYGGAVKTVLETGDILEEWARYCHALGWCTAEHFAPADTTGTLSQLQAPGELVLPYGDGSYYTTGVYAAPVGEVLGAHYATGFRFIVADGRAVLIDVAVAYENLKPPVYWLSEFDQSGVIEVEPLPSSGVAAKLREVTVARHPDVYGWVLATLEVTNTSPTPVQPYVAGADITGFEAPRYNETKATEIANDMATTAGWSWAYGKQILPNDTGTVVVITRFLSQQVRGEAFQLPIFDGASATDVAELSPLHTLQITVGEITACNRRYTETFELRPRLCTDPPLLDHNWYDQVTP